MLFLTAAFGRVSELTLPGMMRSFAASNPGETLYVLTDRVHGLPRLPGVEVEVWNPRALLASLPSFYRDAPVMSVVPVPALARFRERFPGTPLAWIGPDVFALRALRPRLDLARPNLLGESASWGFFPTLEAGNGLLLKPKGRMRASFFLLPSPAVLDLQRLAYERPHWPGPFSKHMLHRPMECLLAHFRAGRDDVAVIRNGRTGVWSHPLRSGRRPSGVPGDATLRRYDARNGTPRHWGRPVILFDWDGHFEEHLHDGLRSFAPGTASYLRRLVDECPAALR